MVEYNIDGTKIVRHWNEKCLPMIRDHHLTTKADEQRFVAYYHKVVDEQIAQRQVEYDNHYRC